MPPDSVKSLSMPVPAATTPPAPTEPTKQKKLKTSAPKAKALHPSWASMIEGALSALNEKHGSSIAAIKKFIVANNKVDSDKVAPHMRRGIKLALASGLIVQAKGKGLTGSFKLGKLKVKAQSKETKLPKTKVDKKKKAAATKVTMKTEPSKKKSAVKKSETMAPAKPTTKVSKKKSAPKPKKRVVAKKTKAPTKKSQVTARPKVAKAPKTPKAPKPKITKKAPAKAKAAAPKKN